MHISGLSCEPYPWGDNHEFVQIEILQNGTEADKFFVPFSAARIFALSLEKLTRPPEYPRFYSQFEVDLLLNEKIATIAKKDARIEYLTSILNPLKKTSSRDNKVSSRDKKTGKDSKSGEAL
jgi:hypothetical protein